MNISYKWLKEYVDCDLTPEEACAALTSTGLEVSAVEEVPAVRGGLKGLYVGKVLTCVPHPNSDHLHITTVDLGRETPSQIVCGAPNVAAGQKVIVADVGCTLYDGDKPVTIKKSRLRGADSYGMICAEDEIGIGTSHDGIIVLPDDAPTGTPAATYYKLESDWLIEIDVTANRADALSHYGVARDLYAWLKANGHPTALHRPDCAAFSVDNDSMPIDVVIENEQACLRYACVSVTDCDVKVSPQWLQDKLTTIGLRPINNVVDITNYIMMAYGQPLHCFDADMVTGRKIVVRTQPEGTKFITLDGAEHSLGTHDLSICNATEPMCIAGIFGGKGSGTYETTRSVVLESACFHPTWIRKSARRHGLSTDASFRFERGVDPEGTIYALKQAAILCRELTGGKISMEIRDVYPSPVKRARVRLGYSYLNTLIGKTIPTDKIKSICDSLEMVITNEDEQGIDIEIPAYRVDVTRPCDVAEDILRIYGYNNIETPTQLRSSLVTKGYEDRKHKLTDIVSEQLVGCGFFEIVNNSLTRSAYYEGNSDLPAEHCVKILNPLSSDLNVMRQTLLYGGLESIRHNINHKNANLKLFEFGNVYHYNADKKNTDDPTAAYSEEHHTALWITGKRVKGSWTHPDEDSSFYELKAYVRNIFNRIGVPDGAIVTAKTNSAACPSALTVRDRRGKTLAMMGTVSGDLLKTMDINAPVYYAEMDWGALMTATANAKVLYKDVCKYPAVSRDLALLIDKSIDFSQIRDTAFQTEKKLLKSVELFDVYEGASLPEGKKSYAVNFILQDETKTLNDKQIDVIMNKLTTNLKNKLGAELR